MRKIIFCGALFIVCVAAWQAISKLPSSPPPAGALAVAAPSSAPSTPAPVTLTDAVGYEEMTPEAVLANGQQVLKSWLTTTNVVFSDDQVNNLINALSEAARLEPSLTAKTSPLAAALRKQQAQRTAAQLHAIADAKANNVEGRDDYAGTSERNFLANGMDVSARTSGPKHTTLTLSYVLMGRPTVYQLVNDPTFLSTLSDLGFKMVVFTDGYDSTWRYDVTKGAFL